MWGSCHFDRASNDKFSVEYWMFVLIFSSAGIKIRSERSPIHLKLSLLSKGTLIIPWRYPKFHDLVAIEKQNNNNDTKFVIWHPVEMTWSGHKTTIIIPNKSHDSYIFNVLI